MDLLKILKKEEITITDKILYFDVSEGKIEKDYFIYWTMEGKKTIWNTGRILLADNPNIYEAFRDAFELKYKTEIPKTKMYDYLIHRKIDRNKKHFMCGELYGN